jgi:hypothetical protein
MSLREDETFARAEEIVIEKEDSGGHEETNAGLTEKKVEFIISARSKKIMVEVDSIKGIIGELRQELSALRDDIFAIKNGKHSFEQKNDEAQKASELKKESHPKQGSFSPENVSVDKFFYCGKK